MAARADFVAVEDRNMSARGWEEGEGTGQKEVTEQTTLCGRRHSRKPESTEGPLPEDLEGQGGEFEVTGMKATPLCIYVSKWHLGPHKPV